MTFFAADAVFAQTLDGLKTIPFHLDKKGAVVYSNPGSKKEYAASSGPKIVSVLRALGLNLKATTLKKYLGSHFPKSYAGKAVSVPVGKGTDIYIVNPADLKGIKLGNADDAFAAIQKRLHPENAEVLHGMGEDVALSTTVMKVSAAFTASTISSSYGSTAQAKQGAKFIILEATLTNTTNAPFTFRGVPALFDQKGRQFNSYDGTIGHIEGYLEMRSLAPGVPEHGFFVYEVPDDASSFKLEVVHSDTDQLHSVLVPASSIQQWVVPQQTSGTEQTKPMPDSTAPTSMQTLTGVTGIDAKAYLGSDGLIIPFVYTANGKAVTDASAYGVSVTATVTVWYEGWDEQANKRSLGGKMFERTYADAQISHDLSGLRVVHIPYVDMTNASKNVQVSAVRLAVATPKQGDLLATMIDVPIASVSAPANDVTLSGDLTGTNTFPSRHFYLEAAPMTLTEYNTGESNIFMWLVSEAGDKSLILNEIGPGSRQDIVKIYNAGWYTLQVQSQGKWNIELKQ